MSDAMFGSSEVMMRKRYSVVDWTDAGTNRWRDLAFAVLMLLPVLAALHSWLWLVAFYAWLFVLPSLTSKGWHRFETLDELKGFVAGLS